MLIQRRKPHVWCKYIIHPFWQYATESSEANEGCIQYIPWGVPVALFLTIHRVCEVLTRQNQSVQLRLICIYVCPTSVHRDFRYGYRCYKDNTFILKTTLFGWKSMNLRSDLTLLNMNMSKNSTFCVIFPAKKFVLSMIIRIFAPSVPTKPLNDAQMRGAFLFIWVYGNKNSVYKNIFHAPWVSAATQNKRYGVLNLGLKSLLFVSNQAHTDLTDSNYFQTLQLLVLQHQLSPAGRRRLNGSKSI